MVLNANILMMFSNVVLPQPRTGELESQGAER